uniref:CHCH domain-containing protein n=1 Tax=Hyaloperonospora arabidopsidis (strain Emoy2) TaxID=559515 RepID=M4BUJ1_HYAAE
MGANVAKPAEPLDDPCADAMKAYVKCVEAKTAESGGLRDGEECEKESEAYRECRRKAKELKAAVKK